MHSLPGLLVLAVLILSCTSCKGKGPAPPKVRPPAPVLLAEAVTGTVPVYVEAIGTVESLSQVSIKSMVNGEIRRVHFSEGQDVARGAVLFTLDGRPFEAAIKKAEADLARIKAQLATARTNADRYSRLLKDGIVTQEQHDAFRTQAESLEADLGAQQANIEALRVQLSYCTIRSPITGRTGNLLITSGNVVKANDTSALVTINQISPIAVSFNIPEPELYKVRTMMNRGGLTAQALPSGDSGAAEQGRVTFVDNAVDTSTGTIKLKATFTNSAKRLWPGQFATVRMSFPPLRDVVTVPSAAVQTGQRGEFVFVAKGDQTVDIRPVRSGVRSGGVTAITEGLKPGEQVVVDGQIRLGQGTRIEVKMPGTVEPGSLPAGLRNNSGAGARTGR